MVGDALEHIEPAILAAASRRLLEDADSPSFRLAAIRYLAIADLEAAERELWAVYEDERLHLNDRARALELFWKCPSSRSRQEPKDVLVDETAPWQLRKAAAESILWSEFDADTEPLLGRALRDPRREVRSKALNAILRFELANLSPELMEAFRKDRSQKGKRQIKHVLRHFSARPDVAAFGNENGFGEAFFRLPNYIHDWEKAREDSWF